MTIKQRQHLLAYLGYYVGTVDGIWGAMSRAACTAFQKDAGIPADGIGGLQTDAALKKAVANDATKPEPVPDVTDNNVGDKSSPTGTFWNGIKYFARDDSGIACPCGRCGGFPVEPVERLMLNADATREHFGRPMIPSSTVRCAAHNAELPGSAANSLHMRGKAMDFAIPGFGSDTIVAYVKTLPEVDECYPIDDSYVHMGVQEY